MGGGGLEKWGGGVDIFHGPKVSTDSSFDATAQSSVDPGDETVKMRDAVVRLFSPPL